MTQRELQRRFDSAADTFDAADFVHAATRDGLLSRLEPMTVEARVIVDLGSATGASSRLLVKKYRRATVVAVDLSRRMLEHVYRRRSWFSKIQPVQGDAACLPLADHSVDVVFSNLLLPWVDDRDKLFTEVARVLRQDGLFIFSTLGPDSLANLISVPFADMHNIGDEMVRARLRDPVLDVDRLTVKYDDPQAFKNDLAAVGAGHCLAADTPSPDVELELVYGHCWGAGELSPPGEASVDISQISRRR